MSAALRLRVMVVPFTDEEAAKLSLTSRSLRYFGTVRSRKPRRIVDLSIVRFFTRIGETTANQRVHSTPTRKCDAFRNLPIDLPAMFGILVSFREYEPTRLVDLKPLGDRV
jgi:hypothetical protein